MKKNLRWGLLDWISSVVNSQFDVGNLLAVDSLKPLGPGAKEAEELHFASKDSGATIVAAQNVHNPKNECAK